MIDSLNWDDLPLGQTVIPAGHVEQAEHVRLVMDYPCQYAFMQHMFGDGKLSPDSVWQMQLRTQSGVFEAGSQAFNNRIGSMIRHRGLIANLTLRENLLLPFLYQGETERLAQAADELDEVAEWIGFSQSLDQKAGERTTFTHAMASLGRCLLLRPSIIIAQEVHLGMPNEHLEQFRSVSMEALERLGSGLIYLTTSENEGSDIVFSRTLTMQTDAAARHSQGSN